MKRYNTPHRSRVIKTRLTEEEYAEFSERVSLCKMSQAEFIRQALIKSSIRPVITVSPVNDELLSAVGKLTAEYGKIGGNLNQIARCLNEYGAPYLASLKKASKETPSALPELAEGQMLVGGDALLKSGTTTPPPRFTEDTLLSAMERASAEDFAKLEEIERKGLGTPATRAGVIEKLVRSGYVERNGRQLIPTEKGMALAWIMPDQLKSAKLTAEWEERLGAVERGELSPKDFMDGITTMISDLVQSYRNVNVAPSALSDSGRAGIGKCPRCGKNVVEGKKSFYCEGYHDTPSCGFALWKNDRFFTSKRKELTKKIAASLLKNGRAAVTGLFSEKKGVLYDATVVLDDDGGKYVRFKLEFDNKSTRKEGK